MLLQLLCMFSCRPSFIADGFIQLVEDESLNGQAMYFDHGKQVMGLHQFNDSTI